MNITVLLNADPAAMALGEVVDAYKALSDVRLAMQKEVDSLEVVEKKYRQHLIDNLAKSNEAGVFGKRYKAQHKTRRTFQVDTQRANGGWPDVWAWIVANNRFDMVQKRLNDKALKDMYDAGKPLPEGVGSLLVSEISVTKI